jgi:hypothetical protein
VYALLSRPIKRISLAATQRISGGEELVVRVGFDGPEGGRLQAALPFVLSVIRPDGQLHQEFFRSTQRDGGFFMSLPIALNVPPGRWRVDVRSQLTGNVTSLPVRILPAATPELARPLTDRAVVRRRTSIEKLFGAKPRMILPVFDSPRADELAGVAQKVKQTLATRGVVVEIRRNPELATFWLAYDPSAEQQRENQRVERGAAIGKIKRTTVNNNDWYCGMSGYRCAAPIVLLDLVGEDDNEMAERLDRLGVLWPQVSDAFPGPGRATVQSVKWAFGPRVDALVIQASDIGGLTAGAESLRYLPPDRLSAGVEQARDILWQEFYIGRRPAEPRAEGLTSNGLSTRRAPRPFAIKFRGQQPPREDQVIRPTRHPHPAYAVPGVIEPKQYVPFVRATGAAPDRTATTDAADEFYESSTASILLHDLRFSDAVLVVVNARRPGKIQIAADGQFRFSDGQPRSQPQWEDVLAVYNSVVHRSREPMSIEVRRGVETIGHLKPRKIDTREVPLSTRPSHGSGKEEEEAVREEVVIEMAGEAELASGRNELLLIHHNIVDGVLDRLRFGVSTAEADAAKPTSGK